MNGFTPRRQSAWRLPPAYQPTRRSSRISQPFPQQSATTQPNSPPATNPFHDPAVVHQPAFTSQYITQHAYLAWLKSENNFDFVAAVVVFFQLINWIIGLGSEESTMSTHVKIGVLLFSTWGLYVTVVFWWKRFGDIREFWGMESAMLGGKVAGS